MNDDLLDKFQAAFEEHLAAMTEQHKRTIALVRANLLHKSRIEKPTAFQQCKAFVSQADAWIQQQVLRRASQDLPSCEDDTAHLPTEDAVVIVDAEYRVVESDSSQEPDGQGKEVSP